MSTLCLSTTDSPVDAPASVLPTRAALLALQNWGANVSALFSTRQPGPLDTFDFDTLDLTWLLARDGAVSAKDATGRWLAGCSVPRLAARAVFGKLDVSGSVGCFLCPSHGQQVRWALDKLGAQQALVVILPDIERFKTVLACVNFSKELTDARLFFVSGIGWSEQLQNMFDDQPGLPVPSQFVRAPLSDDANLPEVISTAQKIFGEVTTRRQKAIEHAVGSFTQPALRTGRVCLLAPSAYRLWDNAGEVLRRTLGRDTSEFEFIHVDPDAPAQAAPLHLVQQALKCDAVVCVDLGRADLPGLFHASQPVLTWVTRPRIPPAAPSGARDGLIVVTESLKQRAIDEGWPASRVRIGGWPMLSTGPSSVVGLSGAVGLIVDTVALDAPKRLENYSSHLLLWNSLRDELLEQPLAMGSDPLAFLTARMRRHGVAGDGLDQRLFVDTLIVPAFHQGLVRLLTRSGIGVKVFGHGWDKTSVPSTLCHGPLRNDDQLSDAVGVCVAVIDVWPWMESHAVRRIQRPVVSVRDRSEASLLKAVRAIIEQRGKSQVTENVPACSIMQVRSLLQ